MIDFKTQGLFLEFGCLWNLAVCEFCFHAMSWQSLAAGGWPCDLLVSWEIREFGVQAALCMWEQGLEEAAGDTRGFYELMPQLWAPQSPPLHIRAPLTHREVLYGNQRPGWPPESPPGSWVWDLDPASSQPPRDSSVRWKTGRTPARYHMIKEPTQSLMCSSSSRSSFWVFPGGPVG